MTSERLNELTNEYLNGIRINECGFEIPLFESTDVSEFAVYDEYGNWISLSEFLQWLLIRFNMKEN